MSNLVLIMITQEIKRAVLKHPLSVRLSACGTVQVVTSCGDRVYIYIVYSPVTLMSAFSPTPWPLGDSTVE